MQTVALLSLACEATTSVDIGGCVDDWVVPLAQHSPF